jgi:hypothetical protein
VSRFVDTSSYQRTGRLFVNVRLMLKVVLVVGRNWGTSREGGGPRVFVTRMIGSTGMFGMLGMAGVIGVKGLCGIRSRFGVYVTVIVGVHRRQAIESIAVILPDLRRRLSHFHVHVGRPN